MNSFLLRNFEIGHFSGYKTQVFGDYFLEISSENDLLNLQKSYHFAIENNLPFLIIGGGTNMLFANDHFEGVVVKNSLAGWSYNPEKKVLNAFSDEPIWDIAQKLEEEYDQDIWHRFIGLPGSLGGAVYGNAGCFGLEVESNFLSCEVFDMLSGQQKTFSKNDMDFSYRHSYLKVHPELFLLNTTFDLSEKREKYHSEVDNIDFRENKQPKGNSCGSFFKNPSREVSAGFLIEKV